MFYVYVLASKRNGTLYIGVTSALVQRVWQHRVKALGGFTARYGVSQLVSFEAHGGIPAKLSFFSHTSPLRLSVTV